ncbi:MAG: glycerol-3-phosphate 1-O-acyltransferase PlsY [Candidatus Heimdallarchaeota archaeon]|nr:glycerol-3-phosphate 1-O-acyltransferase PlsY [Candidatus Heimdallarchaeota archaeon]MCK5143888.1 glycerol-3-phosphate 1-O-acyltransferase PlsY [Candidatus Heimdallarchaeota archaeon]
MAYEILYEILLVVAGYLFGSIPFAYIVGKVGRGIDIRDYGSGNMGATNVMRALGKKAGFLTMGLDMIKGTIPVLLARLYIWLGNYSGFGTKSGGTDFPKFLDEGFLLTLVALMAVVGHALPVWVKFKGGKSAAVGSGAILGINPIAFVIIILAWIPLLKFTKIMSLSNLIMALVAPVIYWIFAGTDWFFNGSLWALIVACIMIVFVFWRHKANIKRLLTGTERKMGEKVELEPESE